MMRTLEHHHHQDEVLLLDVPAVVGAFSQRLHMAGLPVTPSQSAQYARSLGLVDPGSARELYLTTRAVFVTGTSQVATFDRVFVDVFGRIDAIGAEDAGLARVGRG
jgi:uncharacterized protein with von Willebrand factor type A (vWA) domain